VDESNMQLINYCSMWRLMLGAKCVYAVKHNGFKNEHLKMSV